MKSFIFEACEFYYYFSVLGYVVIMVKFATTKKMKIFYDTIMSRRDTTIVMKVNYK